MAANAWKADRGNFFYVAFAWVAVVAALTGFSTTYWLPIARRTFGGPLVAHIHGLFFFGWIALLVGQVHFARAKRIRIHQRLGKVSLVLAPAMALSGLGVAMFAVRRDLAVMGDGAYSQLLGVFTAMLTLVVLVGAAFVLRKRPDWHKRLMLLATVALWWPAWFRWRHLMPWMPYPDITLAIIVPDSMIVIAALRDRIRFGRVHPAYYWIGGALIADHLVETLLFGTPAWRMAAQGLFGLLQRLGY